MKYITCDDEKCYDYEIYVTSFMMIRVVMLMMLMMMSVRRQDFLLSRLGIRQLLITPRDPYSTSRTLSGNDRKTMI